MSDFLTDEEIKKRNENLTGDELDEMLRGRDALSRLIKFGVIMPLLIVLVVYFFISYINNNRYDKQTNYEARSISELHKDLVDYADKKQFDSYSKEVIFLRDNEKDEYYRIFSGFNLWDHKITNIWGGNIHISGDSEKFYLNYYNMPNDKVCKRILPKLRTSGWKTITVDEVVIDLETLDKSNIDGICRKTNLLMLGS